MSRQIPDTVALFGLPITNVTMAQAVARVEEQILSGRRHQIATANLDFARNSLKDQYLQRVICECSMVLPDGAPMLWGGYAVPHAVEAAGDGRGPDSGAGQAFG